tara:strand:- start:1273 stop:2352 length:1080 start_codon:yes stop_codon:yes gene_type:complete
MKSKNIIIHSKILYIFFLFLSLNIFFFSTDKSKAKSFDIDNIAISRPFEINFNKNEVIDDGFVKAYQNLIKLILNSTDQRRIQQIRLNEIKGMVESFSIKEEKFINEIYYVNLGVSFNKKKIFRFLEKNNIFPSIPSKKRIFFIPVLIDEEKKQLLIFSENKIFEQWNDDIKDFHLINYVLPTEDLEDLNLIRNKFEFIEEYDFKEIIDKYNLNDSIIALIFKGKNETRVLSKMNIQKNVTIKNQSFVDLDINNDLQIKKMVNQLKKIYEDYWKDSNQINTSIKLSINVKINNDDNLKIINFEKKMIETDLIYDFFIKKFDKDFTYYQIIFNGTPSVFLKTMNENNYEFDTQNSIWLLK